MIRVALIETAPIDRPGSMNRYADLIELAFREDAEIRIERVRLASPASETDRWPRRLRGLIHHSTNALRARQVARRNPADVYHVVDGSHGYVALSLPPQRTIATAHDVIPLLQSQGKFPVKSPGRFARWLIHHALAGLRHCRRVLCDSRSTARDLVDLAGINPQAQIVMPLAVPTDLMPHPGAMLPDWSARRSAERPFILHIGNNGFYKNRAGVVRIFAKLRQRHPLRLVLAGPPPDLALRELIAENLLGNDVDFVIDPDDRAVTELYRTARLLLFPSIYEGFGWPPLEAMAWDCPVVCTEAGSLGEVVGEAALVGRPEDEAGLAELCERVLTDPDAAAQLVSRGREQARLFSLDRLRESLRQVYREVGASQ